MSNKHELHVSQQVIEIAPPEPVNERYDGEKVMAWLAGKRKRNEYLKTMESPPLFDEVWMEDVEGGSIVWSTGLAKSDEKEFPHNGLLWGVWVDQDQKESWQADIKDQDKARSRMKKKIAEGIVGFEADCKQGILDIHGWGGQEFARIHDLRELLVNLKIEGKDPKKYFVLAQTLMGGLGTRKNGKRKTEIDINMISGQMLSGIKNIAQELAPGEPNNFTLMLSNLSLVQGHSMGGYVISKVAMIMEMISNGFGYDKTSTILGKNKNGNNYLSQELFASMESAQVDAQWMAYNPVVFGNLNKAQRKEMERLMKDRRNGRNQEAILLRKNMLTQLWASKLLPPQVEYLVKLPLIKKLFERVVEQMLGKRGVADDGGWRKWSHVYTALEERGYIVDCNSMLNKPIMLMKTEEELGLLTTLTGQGRYFVSAGDIATGEEKRTESGDDVLQEWINKFFALAIGAIVFIPTTYHYPDLSIAKLVAKIMRVGSRKIGIPEKAYIEMLSDMVRPLRSPMKSVGYSPSSLSD